MPARTLGVHLAEDIREMITLRAKANGVTKSKFAAMVFQQWKADGYPAISTVDSTARALVSQALNDEKSRAGNKIRQTQPTLDTAPGQPKLNTTPYAPEPLKQKAPRKKPAA